MNAEKLELANAIQNDIELYESEIEKWKIYILTNANLTCLLGYETIGLNNVFNDDIFNQFKDSILMEYTEKLQALRTRFEQL